MLALLCNIYAVAFAQDFTVGLKYGYGEGYFKMINSPAKTTFTTINQYELTLAYSPYYSKLSVESGVGIERKEFVDYFSVPLGFRIAIGKTVRPFIEGGVYYSFLMDDNSEEYIMKNDYGAQLGGGLQIALGRQWRFELGFLKKFGFANSLIEKKPIAGNLFIDEKSHISPFNAEVAIKYRF